MSPYFPHCIKSNKNSVLLKDKKVVLCGRFGCHYLLITPLRSTSLKECAEQSKGPIFRHFQWAECLTWPTSLSHIPLCRLSAFPGGCYSVPDSGIDSQFAPPMSPGDLKAWEKWKSNSSSLQVKQGPCLLALSHWWRPDPFVDSPRKMTQNTQSQAPNLRKALIHQGVLQSWNFGIGGTPLPSLPRANLL